MRHLIAPGIALAALDGAGESVAVIGPSGAAKTRLLRALADLDPNRGELSIAGVERSGVSGRIHLSPYGPPSVSYLRWGW